MASVSSLEVATFWECVGRGKDNRQDKKKSIKHNNTNRDLKKNTQ